MKNIRVFTAVFASMLLSAVGVQSARGQVVDIVKINLPFEVAVAGNTLSAGQYTIQKTTTSNGVPILLFRSAAGKSVEVFGNVISTPGNSASQRTEISVNGHDLVNLWIAGQSAGYNFTN